MRIRVLLNITVALWLVSTSALANLQRDMGSVEFLIESRNYSLALEKNLMLKAKKTEDEAKIYYQRGRIYLALDRDGDAYTSLTYAFLLNALHPAQQRNLARILAPYALEHQNENLILKLADSGFVSFRNDDERAVYINTLFRKNRCDEALEEAYVVTETRSGAWPGIWQVRLECERKLSRWHELQATIAEMNALFGPSRSRVHLSVLTYDKLGKPGAAASALHEGIQTGLLTKDGDYFNLAYYLSQADLSSRAVKVLSDAVASGQINDTQAAYKRILKYQLATQDLKAAHTTLDTLNETGTDTELAWIRAQLAAKEDNWRETKTYAALAVSGFARNMPPAWELYGYAAFKLKDYKAARYAFTRLAELEPGGTAGDWLNTLDIIDKK
ncbi:hypothetical protein NF212_05260 [Parasalinivibrio latis]|uniref:hypothetical protein n=1 Tax=Parasalinivibrio latis TaxID=2952610 RepID=UPI0030DE2E9F